MANCVTLLSKDLGFDCSKPAIEGIDFQALLIKSFFQGLFFY